MIDLHAHVLPGIDDGPRDLAAAIALAAAAAHGGAHTVVATPHVNERFRNSAEEIRAAVHELRAALRAEGVVLSIIPGAEIDIQTAIGLEDSELTGLRLGKGPYLFLESPLSPAAGDFEHMIRELAMRGHRIILGHPERCPAFQRDPARLTALVNEGVLSSITAGALTGRFGGGARRYSAKLLREGLVHNIASDMHNLSGRPPGVASASPAAEELVPGITQRFGWFTNAVPRAVLAGKPLPAPPEVPAGRARPRRGMLARLNFSR